MKAITFPSSTTISTSLLSLRLRGRLDSHFRLLILLVESIRDGRITNSIHYKFLNSAKPTTLLSRSVNSILKVTFSFDTVKPTITLLEQIRLRSFTGTGTLIVSWGTGCLYSKACEIHSVISLGWLFQLNFFSK